MNFGSICRWVFIACFVMSLSCVQAQTHDAAFSIKYSLLDIPKVSLSPVNAWIHPYKKAGHFNNIPGDLIYSKYYGKICQWETQRDHRTKQKVRFRLGTLADANRLEGK